MSYFYAITMAPMDWGISIAALMMLLFAARTLVSGKGRSQMGLSFAVLAAVVWTFAIGRHIEGFSTVDGIRVAVGALLLVPVLKALFSQTGSSITGAVVAVLLASWAAGPVIARYSPNVVQADLPPVERLTQRLEEVDKQLASSTATAEVTASHAATERAKLVELGVTSEADVDATPEALTALKRWSLYKGELNQLSLQIKDLRGLRAELQTQLSALERAGGDDASIAEADRIRELVEREAGRDDKTIVESYTDRAKMLELLESEFGAQGSFPEGVPEGTPAETSGGESEAENDSGNDPK